MLSHYKTSKPDESKYIRVKGNVYIAKDDPDFVKKFISEHARWPKFFDMQVDSVPELVEPAPLEFNLEPEWFEDEAKPSWSLKKKFVIIGLLGSILIGSILGLTYAIIHPFSL
ncbi:hypothetical protein [Paenibacillus aestuarii]|uniref:Uncharacterized protein n=1 Tax=Paenibacillus aestuarii TaxID=516965 RepID=A0ABW0K4S6_9BACL|nr:hypothetical protein [Paenibacillus aestuarii]